MKYKIGDIVKVKENLISGKSYGGLMFSPFMEKYKGKTFMVANIVADNVFNFGMNNGLFSSEMVELIKPLNETNVIDVKVNLHKLTQKDQATLITLLNNTL